MKPFSIPKHLLVIYQLSQWFLNFHSLKIWFINLTLCCLTLSLQIWSLQKAKTHPISIHQSIRRNGFVFFFGAIQALTFCIKSATHRLPVWNPSWSCQGLLLLQKDEHPLYFLTNPRCISYLHVYLFQDFNLFETYFFKYFVMDVSGLSCILAWHIHLVSFPQSSTNVKWMCQMGYH